jgi:hypothetical protein
MIGDHLRVLMMEAMIRWIKWSGKVEGSHDGGEGQMDRVAWSAIVYDEWR